MIEQNETLKQNKQLSYENKIKDLVEQNDALKLNNENKNNEVLHLKKSLENHILDVSKVAVENKEILNGFQLVAIIDSSIHRCEQLVGCYH